MKEFAESVGFLVDIKHSGQMAFPDETGILVKPGAITFVALRTVRSVTYFSVAVLITIDKTRLDMKLASLFVISFRYLYFYVRWP